MARLSGAEPGRLGFFAGPYDHFTRTFLVEAEGFSAGSFCVLPDRHPASSAS